MGDALTGGDVPRPDELDTIDAVDKTVEPPALVVPPELKPVHSAHDHPRLLTVDRSNYLVTGEIAKGGMGRVLEARDLRLGRAVAIKELLPRNRDAALRFEREARITARLQHPAIIHVYEAGVWSGGEPFYAMPKVSGRSLDKVVVERSSLVERLGLLPNVIAVADALAYAHNENVIHRDLKPSNVLVGAFGETVVIDWGLAKDVGAPSDPMESLQMRLKPPPTDTSDGGVIGTPAYMPPEQAKGRSVDQRADVYALGALLYHVLVGGAPYTGDSSADVLEQVKRGACRPVREREPGAPADLVAIVDKAMARDPEDRYANAAELAQDLKRFETGQLVAAHHYTTWQLFWRWLRRYRVPIAIGAVATVIIAILGAWSITRIVEKGREAIRGRNVLLEERGRSELLDGHAGAAAVYLVEAAKDGAHNNARAFLMAEALRPFEAQRRLLHQFEKGTVAIAYSPDGTHIVAAGSGDAHIWTSDGTPEVKLAGIAGRTTVVAFDRAGTRILTAGEDRIARVWSRDGQWHVDLRGHRGAIRDAAFSNDGSRVVTASDDATVRVWTIAEPDHAVVLTFHQAPVVSVRFSPDDRWIATASEDGTGCIANRSSSHCDAPLRAHQGAVLSVRWNPDGKYVLTASADGTARVWDAMARGSWIKGKPMLVPMRHPGGVVSAEFSSDGRYVLTAGADRVARIFELPDVIKEDTPTETATEIRKLPGADAFSGAVFSADDTTISTSERDGHTTVWDAVTGRVIAAFEHADEVDAVRFGPDGHTLLTASLDGAVRLWDIPGGDVARASYETDSAIHAIAVAHDGTVAAACDNSKIFMWSGDKQHVLADHLGRVFAVAFSPDGRWLVSGGEEEQAYVFDVASRKRIGELRPHGDGVHGIAFSPDGEIVATSGGDAIVRLWSMRDRKLIASLPYQAVLTNLIFDHAGDVLAGLDEDGRVVLWPMRGVIAPIMMRLTSSPTRAIAFSRDGTRFVASGATDTRIFAFAHGRIDPNELSRLDGPFGSVTSARFSRDGARVITAGGDGVVRIWDAAKGKLIAVRDARGTAITAMVGTDDDQKLWTGEQSGTVRSWDVHVETRPISELDRVVRCRVPWQLDSNDNVQLRSEPPGDCNGQR